jgi:hypothetical protein
MTDFERIEYDQMISHVRSLLNKSVSNSLWAEGRAMTTEQAIELALSD